MKIKIEEVPNEAILDFHIDKHVSSMLIVGSDSIEDIQEEWDLMNEGKEAPTSLITLAIALFDIPGVNTLGFDKYEITVEKADLFEWKEIEPQVIEVIKTHFLKEGEIINYLPRTKCTEEDREDVKESIKNMNKGGSRNGSSI